MQESASGRQPADTDFSAIEVILGLGANVGDPARNILDAFAAIAGDVLQEAVLSSLYVTEPQDVKAQPDFINASCRGFFSGSAFDLLKKISIIEHSLGRKRAAETRRGPRSIDIDILLFGSMIIEAGAEVDGEGCWLRIPHERLKLRKFALVPMLELKPEAADPVTGEPFSNFVKKLDQQGIYKYDI